MLDGDVNDRAAVIDHDVELLFHVFKIVHACDGVLYLAVCALKDVASRRGEYLLAGGAQQRNIADDYLTADGQLLCEFSGAQGTLGASELAHYVLASFCRIHL